MAIWVARMAMVNKELMVEMIMDGSPSQYPALGLLSCHVVEAALFENEEDTADASLLVGPKFTVRLPYAVHIDVVTLEHRSFPLSPSSSLENEKKGGESAPRWVRVVGFPTWCPTTTKDEMEDECGVRGFDISKPIDLGSFEYQRITVTGREDDYGGSDGTEDENGENDPWSGRRRRRSIQTFAVNGGKWKPSSLFGNDASEDSLKEKEDYVASADPTQCESILRMIDWLVTDVSPVLPLIVESELACLLVIAIADLVGGVPKI